MIHIQHGPRPPCLHPSGSIEKYQRSVPISMVNIPLSVAVDNADRTAHDVLAVTYNQGNK